MAGENMPDTGPRVEFPTLDEAAQPGIYFLFRKGVVVYVGQAVDMRRRIGQHLGDGGKVFDAVSFKPYAVDKLAAMERRYIELFVPEYNNCRLTVSLRAAGAESLPFVRKTVRIPGTRSRKTILV